MGAGNVLPIWRGGGIDQPLFHDFARQVHAPPPLPAFIEKSFSSFGAPPSYPGATPS